ncbi:unnamed protein product [Knipowitschia caucasica]|uniref:RING-type domain-containing protein n=1 Tax=Knipowitschia caucasica TaxID=637954 RepID=A0AAV2KLI0_KNICA
MEQSAELECAVCFLTYNAGRRCPRELHCKHTFCESCLLALAQAVGLNEADRAIVCPLCRQTTCVSAEERLRAQLRVDESAMEQLLLSELLLTEDPAEPNEPEKEEETEGQLSPCESSAQDSDLSMGSSRLRLRRTLRRVWKKISGRDAQQNENDFADMSSEDMRNFALFASYMF